MSTVKTNQKDSLVIASVNPFTGLDNKPSKIVAQSQLTILKTTINKSVEGEVKSVSKYFSEFRKNFDNINAFLKEAHSKGRTFNAELCHDILMNGNLKEIIKSDKTIQDNKASKNAKFVAPTQWSANRMFVAFIHAVETTVKK